MNKYFVFAGPQLEEFRGWNSFIKSFSDQKKAEEYCASLIGREFSFKDDIDLWTIEDCLRGEIQWAQVIDVDKAEIVFKSGVSFGTFRELALL